MNGGTRIPQPVIDVLRQKRQFIPDGFRDDDGVWHDGPHQAEFDAAVEAIEEAVNAAHDAAILTYNPKATTAENDELQRRAKRLREAFDRLGMRHA